jgi:hypothetical protein
MGKLSPFQKFCARFSRKLPGVTSILMLIISIYAAQVSIQYCTQHQDDPMALYIAMASVALLALTTMVVLIISPIYLVGTWKSRLPEEAIKYAESIKKEFPPATENLDAWIKVAIEEDDGTSLQAWAYYFEQLSEKKKIEARVREKIEKIKTEFEQLCLKKPQ